MHPEPAAAIRFARDFDVPSILPFAFYVLAGISQYKDWDEDRKDDVGRPIITASLGRTARWKLLDAVDYRTLVKCREALTSDLVFIMNQFEQENELMMNTLCNDYGFPGNGLS